MDPNYNPKAPASEMEDRKNIFKKSGKDSKYPIHEPLVESVKQGANPYAVTQAFQIGLPGVNR